ncbi:MAG: radical SAM protein [Candidatus Omnitrophica bacterium]|nr:radical SAM protein [Candidatus Omnitrophota bacterium]
METILSKENIGCNEQEIARGETVLASKPRKLNIALTTACNISCIMCEAKKISWQVPEKTIKEVMAFFPYVERVIWQGGEVFLYPPFKEVLQEAARFPQITHEITTNAHMLNEEWIKLLGRMNLDINISVDAFSKDVYDYIRKGSRFEELLRILGLLHQARKENKQNVAVLIFTVIKSNYKELPQVVEFAKRYHFDRIIVQPVKGNYDNEENIFYRNNSEALAYIGRIKPLLKEQAKAAGIDLFEWLPTALTSSVSLDAPSGKPAASPVPGRKEIFCYAPWQQLFIEWGGKVYPHCLCVADGENTDRVIGNVLEEPLIQIWNSPKAQEFRRRMASGDIHTLCNNECLSGRIAANLRNIPFTPKENMAARPSGLFYDILLGIEKGKQASRAGKFEEAIAEFKHIIDLEPGYQEAQFEMGKAYYLQGRLGESADVLERLMAKNPSCGDAGLLLAKMYKTQRRFSDALVQLKPLLQDVSLREESAQEVRDIYPHLVQELKELNNQGCYSQVVQKVKELRGIIPEDDIFYRNKLLSEEEIARHTLVVEAKMRNLIVTLSTTCNLNCVMCEERRIRWDIPRHILEEVISYFPYLERVVWQGGEAFTVPYFDELLEKAAAFPYLRQVITTNGLLIDDKRAERLVKSNVDLTFSIDGITKDIYEKVRQGANFELLMRNLATFNVMRKKYQNQLLNTNLHVVIMKSNYHQLEEFIDFAKDHEFRLVAFLPIGGNYQNPENIFHSRDEAALKFLTERIPRAEEKAKRYGIMLENRLPKLSVESVGQETTGTAQGSCTAESDRRLLCHLPWLQLYIDYDGTIRPDCVCRAEIPIGNTSCDTLKEVWNNQKMQEYRRKIIEDRCEEICNPECTKKQVSERYLKFS